jgi:hypothetical protein
MMPRDLTPRPGARMLLLYPMRPQMTLMLGHPTGWAYMLLSAAMPVGQHDNDKKGFHCGGLPLLFWTRSHSSGRTITIVLTAMAKFPSFAVTMAISP